MQQQAQPGAQTKAQTQTSEQTQMQTQMQAQTQTQTHPQTQRTPTRWRLLRNCSLRPAQLFAFCCAPGVLALLAALPFILQGYVWISVFAVVQLPCLVLASLACGIHALDGELLSIDDGRVRLECRNGWRVHRHEWPLHSVRVLGAEASSTAPGLLLWAAGHEHVVGRQRPAAELQVVARQLREALAILRPAVTLP